MKRLRVLGLAGALAATVLATAPAASAAGRPLPGLKAHPATSSSLGTTTVTTAPGIATTLIGAGILPLPVLPDTGFGISLRNGLAVSYGFPITSNTADLTTGTGKITHLGGILFVGANGHLEIGKFTVNLGAGKIFAREVNFAAARVPVLDLDLSGLQVGTDSSGNTVLSNIVLRLDPAGAGALNATFGTALPADGSLVFGTARIVIKP